MQDWILLYLPCFILKKMCVGLFVCLFFCLTGHSVQTHTCLGPDGTRLEQNTQARLKSLYKHAGQLVFENVKKETDLKIMRWRKRRPLPLPKNQVEQYYCQPLGQEKGDFLSNLICHWG